VQYHYWWCISTCSSNEDLVERFQSICHHVINRHEWTGCQTFKECAHPNLAATQARKVKWMAAGSASYLAFQKIIMSGYLRNDSTMIEVRNMYIISSSFIYLTIVSSFLYKHVHNYTKQDYIKGIYKRYMYVKKY